MGDEAKGRGDAPPGAAPPGADWKPRLEELERRRAVARGMGGEERLARQHAAGKLDARARLARLFDPGSFREIGTLVGGAAQPPSPADGFVTGQGEIEGRPALAGAEDVTVQGGSIGLAGADKRTRLTELAGQEQVPLVFLLEGGGHRMTNALEPHGRTPNDLQGLASLSGRVPMACGVLGASAGHGALAAPLMDYVVMSRGASLFTAGPVLVRAATGEDVTKEALGGPDVQVATSGVAHDVEDDDAAVIDRLRRFLHYLPGSAFDAPPERVGPDAGERLLDDGLERVPADSRRPYSMRDWLPSLCDEGSVFELQAGYGASLVTAFAFLGGRSVAIVANDPSVRAGSLDVPAAEKGARFLELAGAYHLPVVFLADNPGVLAGSRAEASGILRASARMFAAQHRLASPKLHVTLRKAFGFGSSVMGMNPFDGQTISLAWPGVSLGAMPAQAGGRAAKVEAETQAELAAREALGPWSVAHGMGFDEVIDPRETRNALLAALRLGASRAGRAKEPVARVGVLP